MSFQIVYSLSDKVPRDIEGYKRDPNNSWKFIKVTDHREPTMRSFGKPKIAEDWSTIEYTKRPKDWEPPPPIEGYVRDSDNPWKFMRVWPDCTMRSERHQIKLCGRLVLVGICRCQECPLVGRPLKVNDCRQCEHRQ